MIYIFIRGNRVEIFVKTTLKKKGKVDNKIELFFKQNNKRSICFIKDTKPKIRAFKVVELPKISDNIFSLGEIPERFEGINELVNSLI